MAKAKQFKIPKQLAACADLLYETREQRLALQKQIDNLSKQESALKEHLINNLPKSEASGVAGKVCRVTVVTKEKPNVVDQEVFRKYMSRTRRFDLAQNLQPSAPAIRDMWESGKDIPGVEKFNAVTVSMNKV